MEDYRRQGGIQQLLVAEQEARQIVNSARTGIVFIFPLKKLAFVDLNRLMVFVLSSLAKLNRLKQAKAEAEEEVAKYRVQMEKEYQKTVSEV